MKKLKAVSDFIGFLKSGMYYNSFKILLSNSPVLTIVLVILVVLSGLLWPLNSYFLQLVINAFTGFFSGTGSQSGIAFSLLFMIIGLIFFPIIDNVINLLKVRLTYNMQKWYRKQIFHKVKNIEYKVYEDKEMHDLYSRVIQTVDLPMTTALSIIEVLKQVVSVIGFTIIIVQAQWLIIPFVALFVLPLIRIGMKNADKTYKLSVERSSSIRYASYLSGFFFVKNIIREMSVFGFKKYIEKKWGDLYAENFKEQQKVTLSNGIYSMTGMLIHGFGGMFATFLLLIPLAMGKLQLGSFVAANNSIGNLTVLLAYSFGNVLSKMRNCWNQWNDFKSFQNIDEKTPLLSSDNQAENICLEFDDVWFKYPNTNRWVIQGISFKIDTGSKVVIVGKNGMGKSTIIKLAMGLYKPQKGNVRIRALPKIKATYCVPKAVTYNSNPCGICPPLALSPTSVHRLYERPSRTCSYLIRIGH
jgi:ATP-binding cassette subfamily B protein